MIDKIATLGVSGRSPVWGTAYETDLVWSIFFNAHNAAYYDLDDGHRRAQGHPGAAVIPAALALSQHLGRSCREFLEAVVAGYENSDPFRTCHAGVGRTSQRVRGMGCDRSCRSSGQTDETR